MLYIIAVIITMFVIAALLELALQKLQLGPELFKNIIDKPKSGVAHYRPIRARDNHDQHYSIPQNKG